MRPSRIFDLFIPFSAIALLLVAWHVSVALSPSTLIPSPRAVARAIVELTLSGRLQQHVVASLFRVTWGYLAAALLAVPAGVLIGLHRRAELGINPVVQLLRPISPLAWIPISILWFGVGDLAAIFLIFLATFFPLMVSAATAVKNLDPVYVDAGANFGLSERDMLRRVIYPAIFPQLINALRISLGIAWLVVVAAEMIAVNSGLGFLIIDARNAGNRYDLVVAGMVMIGTIGLALDSAIRALDRLPSVRWGYLGR